MQSAVPLPQFGLVIVSFVLNSRSLASSSNGVGEKVRGLILSLCCCCRCFSCCCCFEVVVLLILTVVASLTSAVSPISPSPSLSLRCLGQRGSSSATNSVGSCSRCPLSCSRLRWTLCLRWNAPPAMYVVSKAWYWMAHGAVRKIGILVMGHCIPSSFLSAVTTAVCNIPHLPLFLFQI